MKYIRTKDGRIVEESKLEPGFKGFLITFKNKHDNSVIETLIGDYIENPKQRSFIHSVMLGNYCHSHNLDARNIKVEEELIYNDVLEQADTIEELCDEFVIIPIDQNKKPITYFIRHINEPIKPFVTDSHIIYAAIWTDKGLIYVAKMNDKGELELL